MKINSFNVSVTKKYLSSLLFLTQVFFKFKKFEIPVKKTVFKKLKLSVKVGFLR